MSRWNEKGSKESNWMIKKYRFFDNFLQIMYNMIYLYYIFWHGKEFKT